MKKIYFYSILVMCLFGVSTMAQTSYHVKTDGSDMNDGLSWENAFATFSKAYTTAAGGSIIKAAQGTFVFTSQLTFNKSLTLKGGYNPVTGEQDYSNKTIIDGNNAIRMMYIQDAWLNVTMDNFIFQNGNNPTGYGVVAFVGRGTISNCIFRNNKALATNMGGGALGFSGTPSGGETFIVNCVFHNNSGYNGGAIFFGGARTLNIINSTIADNTCVSGDGGGIYYGATAILNLRNSIMWGNKKGASNQIRGTGTTNLNHNIIEGGKGQVAGTVNVINDDDTDAKNSNPLFVDNVVDNYKLQTGSPAINAGDNALIPAGTTTDVKGESRILNTTVDLGAYEFDNTTTALELFDAGNSSRIYQAADCIVIASRSTIQQIRVLDLTGKTHISGISKPTEDAISINISHLNKGIYLISTDNTVSKIVLK